jgi:Histidine kinase-like ATPase domain
MPVGTARTSTAIKVSIARDPALVRTVRLVAAAVARRTGQDEDFVEEIRLAIGEACALMIGEKSAAPEDESSGPVEVTMAIADRFRVEVASSGKIAVEDDDSDADGVQPWSLLRGLIEDFGVTREGPVTTFSMSWPLP